MKQPGISLRAGPAGPIMRVTRPTYAEDAVWEAISNARDENWDFQRFIDEAKDAWEESLNDEIKDVRKMKP